MFRRYGLAYLLILLIMAFSLNSSLALLDQMTAFDYLNYFVTFPAFLLTTMNVFLGYLNQPKRREIILQGLFSSLFTLIILFFFQKNFISEDAIGKIIENTPVAYLSPTLTLQIDTASTTSLFQTGVLALICSIGGGFIGKAVRLYLKL